MPSVRAPIRVEAGSYEPQYWLITDPATGDPVDLTQSGFSVSMVVEDPKGTELLVLDDTSTLRRTVDGRVYFEPLSTLTTTWPTMRAGYQVELTPPAGPDYTVRIGHGPFSVDNEFIKG